MLCPPKALLYKPKLDIRAVRGPKTREILQKHGYDCPAVYGDPAILLPLFYQPQPVQCRRDYSVVLHKSAPAKVPHQIEILRHGFESFIDEIVSSKLVVSASLHGIILAESYGIPAVLLADDRRDFNLLKYEDYYRSTGRYSYPIAATIEEALKMTPAPLPALEPLRNGLLAAFPTDLWETE